MAKKRKRKPARSPAVPVERLNQLIQEALRVARIARRHSKSLSGDNFYANKLAELRVDAIGVFRQLKEPTAGDAAALAELIEVVFGDSTLPDKRLAAARETSFTLQTSWRQQPEPDHSGAEEGLFPLSILQKANRGYLTSVGRQMNGCYSKGWYDACAVMMRRLVEIAIIEAFEAHGRAAIIKDGNDNYFQLTELVGKTLGEPSWTLSRNTKKYLPMLRDVGHMSAHGRYYHARKEDVDAVRQPSRVTIEELLTHAKLL